MGGGVGGELGGEHECEQTLGDKDKYIKINKGINPKETRAITAERIKHAW